LKFFYCHIHKKTICLPILQMHTQLPGQSDSERLLKIRLHLRCYNFLRSATNMGAEYCDQHVCMFVRFFCLSTRISRKPQ